MTTELTSEQRKIMAQFVADENGGDADDYIDDDFAVTRDEFSEFDGRHWAECSDSRSDDDVGHPNCYFASVQTAAGEFGYED